MKFTTTLSGLLICMLTLTCERKPDPFDIKGTWYYDSGNDTANVAYTELYFNDTTYYPQDERFGQWYHPNKYRLTVDSLLYQDEDKIFRAYYKIQRFHSDTLFLRASPLVRSKKDVFWVRLPKNEKGHYDHVWTTSNTDSLNYVLRNDFHRRMIKYHLFLKDDLRTYDSMVRTGYWDFTMKDVIEEKNR